MVVESKRIDVKSLDLSYLALFLGQRVNEIVMQRLKRAGFRSVRESHGYVIQHLIDGDRSISDLARRMGVTQQAASKTVAEMIRLGMLEALPAVDRRAKAIRISTRGWESIRLSRRVRGQLDRRLEGILGAREHQLIKGGLIECLTNLGGVQRIQAHKVREPK